MARLGLLLNGVRRITSSNFCTIVPNERFKRWDKGVMSVGDARKWALKIERTISEHLEIRLWEGRCSGSGQ
ncbi:hypothetical protein EMIT0357P_10572 [Pseudomonas marginalis]